MNLISRKLMLPIVTIAVLLLMVVWLAGVFDARLQPGQAVVSSAQLVEGVAVVKVEKDIFEPVPATVQAKQTTIISSRVLARIDRVHVKAGDSVKLGQLLMELEKTDFQSRVSQASATAESISARLIEARQSLGRAVELAGKGVLSQSELDRAQANHDALLADLGTAQQGLLEAETALDFTQVKAPIAGRIVDRFAEPGDTAQPGVKLLSLYNPLTLRIEANVREKLALALTLGQSLQVQIPALGTLLHSEIEELVPAGNTGSRSFQVKSRLPSSGGLLPGMYARLLVPAGRESVLLIPEDRVVRVGQLDLVWVDIAGERQRRFVRVGKADTEGLVEIISGLEEGERVLPLPVG